MKIGRPRLKTTEKKAQIIGVRVTPEDRRLLDLAAVRSRKKLSEWARETLLSQANAK